MRSFAVCFVVALGHAAGFTPCDNITETTPPADREDVPSVSDYSAQLKTLNVEALMEDMKALLRPSHACWPNTADYGHYGPLFVRLAWHCSGTFRKTDGKGGCGGGRQRFEPERSWEDNANLDKARALLYPLKQKYGDALSWGDLYITAGTVALRDMGTPITQLCFGRIDEADGTKSLPLDNHAACSPHDGQCKAPLGATTVGLIYVNPEGPVLTPGGKPTPEPNKSVVDVRSTFERMGANDRQTVALIGGGHAFGKTHGACSGGSPGDSPKVAFAKSELPYQGTCGTGNGNDTYTSGFEGPWTTNPIQWDNEYFRLLTEQTYEKHVGPGGHYQWRISNATGALKDVMMLTADLALLYDAKYKAIVEEFAKDEPALGKAFDEAWFQLTTTNGNTWSPESKCDTGVFPQNLHTMLSTDECVDRRAVPLCALLLFFAFAVYP
jgi:catalase (peroxidase I)